MQVLRSARVWVVALLGVVSLGCGPSRPQQDPLDYLRVGVDPSTEADAVTADLEAAGFAVWRRVETERVVVLEALRGTDDASAVRVITSLGMALGLDTPDRRHPYRTRVGAVRAPLSGVDITDDGHPEVLLFVRDERRIAPCVAIVSLDRHDRARELGTPAGQVQEGACMERVEDVNNDGLPELIAVARYDVGLPVPARVAVPYASTEGRLVRAGPLASDFYERERVERRQALSAARRDGRHATITRLAVELALTRLYEAADLEGSLRVLTELAGDTANVDVLVASRALLRQLADSPAVTGQQPEPDTEADPDEPAGPDGGAEPPQTGADEAPEGEPAPAPASPAP